MPRRRYNPPRMFRVFGVLFLALGLIVLGVAVLAVVRGRTGATR